MLLRSFEVRLITQQETDVSEDIPICTFSGTNTLLWRSALPNLIPNTVREQVVTSSLTLGYSVLPQSQASAMPDSHEAVAVDVAKHRGSQRNPRSKLAITLFNAVHAQVVSFWPSLPNSVWVC